MQALLSWLIALVVVGISVAGAMVARKRFLMSKRRLIRDGAVAAAGALGLWIAVLIVHARSSPSAPSGAAFDRVFDGLCATPAAGEDSTKAFHGLVCTRDSRRVDLRGASEYQGVWAHLVTKGDALALFTPRPDLVPAAPAGKGYRLWLLDGTGNVVDNARLDKSMSTLIVARPHVAEAIKAVITIEAPNAAKPTGAIVVQGVLEAPRAN